jgi:hypothetical protein
MDDDCEERPLLDLTRRDWVWVAVFSTIFTTVLAVVITFSAVVCYR